MTDDEKNDFLNNIYAQNAYNLGVQSANNLRGLLNSSGAGVGLGMASNTSTMQQFTDAMRIDQRRLGMMRESVEFMEWVGRVYPEVIEQWTALKDLQKFADKADGDI